MGYNERFKTLSWLEDHPHQKTIDKLLLQFIYIYVVMAREGGKTYKACKWLLEEALWPNQKCSKCGGVCKGWLGWFSPRSDKYEEAVACMKELLAPEMYHHNSSSKELKLLPYYDSLGRQRWGETIHFYTCHNNDDPATSHHYRRVVIDEGPMIKNLIFERSIFPALGAHNGRLLAIGTSRGRKTWHHKGMVKGRDKTQKMFGSYDAGASIYTVSDEFRKIVQETISPELYQQEMLGITLDDAAPVFKGFLDCIRGVYLSAPEAMHIKYLAGVDLGKHVDYTVVFIGAPRTNQVVARYRFAQGMNWKQQCEKIIEILGFWNCSSCLIDATGVGDAVFDILMSMHPPCEIIPFKFTAESKPSLIQKLIIDVQSQKIHYPKDDELIDEMENFEYVILPSRKISYGAPQGFHDDMVIALALLNWLFTDIGCHDINNLEILSGNRIALIKKEMSNW